MQSLKIVEEFTTLPLSVVMASCYEFRRGIWKTIHKKNCLLLHNSYPQHVQYKRLEPIRRAMYISKAFLENEISKRTHT